MGCALRRQLREPCSAAGASMAKGAKKSYLGEDERRGRTRRSQVNARGAVEERAGGGRLLAVMMAERRWVVLSWRVVVSRSGRRLNTWNLSSGAAELELRVGQGTCASSAVSSLCDSETTGANWAV